LQPFFQQFCLVMAPAAAHQTCDAAKAPEIAMPFFYQLDDYRFCRPWAHFCCHLCCVILHASFQPVRIMSWADAMEDELVAESELTS